MLFKLATLAAAFAGLVAAQSGTGDGMCYESKIPDEELMSR